MDKFLSFPLIHNFVVFVHKTIHNGLALLSTPKNFRIVLLKQLVLVFYTQGLVLLLLLLSCKIKKNNLEYKHNCV